MELYAGSRLARPDSLSIESNATMAAMMKPCVSNYDDGPAEILGRQFFNATLDTL